MPLKTGNKERIEIIEVRNEELKKRKPTTSDFSYKNL